MKRLISMIAVIVAALSVTAVAFAASTNTQWNLGSYTAKGGFSFKKAKSGNFKLPVAPNPALDLTNKSTLVGDQLGKTITATFTLSDPANTYTYGGEADGSGGPGVANARLYFDSASIVGKQQVSTNYWWSDADIQDLANGAFTVTAVIDPTLSWSAYYGEPSSSNTAAFDAAASHIKDIGLSFGGGYFAANGVGTPDGKGTFTLTSFTVS